MSQKNKKENFLEIIHNIDNIIYSSSKTEQRIQIFNELSNWPISYFVESFDLLLEIFQVLLKKIIVKKKKKRNILVIKMLV